MQAVEVGLDGYLVFSGARERAVDLAAGDFGKEGGRETAPKQGEDGEASAHLWDLNFGDALGDEALEVEVLDVYAREVIGAKVLHLDACLGGALDGNGKSVKKPSVGESLIEKEQKGKESEGSISCPSEELLETFTLHDGLNFARDRRWRLWR